MDPEARLDELMTRLKARCYRMTPQRVAILRVLLSDESHPSIDDIYQRVKTDFPMMSLATVYKTVALLQEMGEVLEVTPAGDVAHYDGIRPYPHPHLICGVCGRIADVAVDDLAEWVQAAAIRAGGWELTTKVDFWGVCPECRATSEIPGDGRGGKKEKLKSGFSLDSVEMMTKRKGVQWQR